jgi:hypothetical protein
MGKEIFDQERPKSALARGLQDAFAGCEKWTIAPSQRRSTLPPPTQPAPAGGASLGGPTQQF